VLGGVALGDDGAYVVGGVDAQAVVPGALGEGLVARAVAVDVFPSLGRAETELVGSITDDMAWENIEVLLVLAVVVPVWWLVEIRNSPYFVWSLSSS